MASGSLPLNDSERSKVKGSSTKLKLPALSGARNEDTVLSKFSLVNSLKYKFNASDILIPQKILYNDFRGTSGLRSLQLKNWKLYPLVFRHISTTCVNLSLENCEGVDCASLECIRGHSNLKRLSVSGTHLFVDISVAKVFSSFKSLLILNVSECSITTESLRLLSQNCVNVVTFLASKCTGIDNFGLRALGQWVQRYRKLGTIDLSDTLSTFGDDGVLDVLTVGYNVLIDVNISNCKNLSTLCVTGLRGKMSALLRLNISRMNFSQSVFEWIAEGCKNIMELDLSKSLEIDDAAISKIGRSCWNIKVLNISKCVNITDGGIVGFMSRFEGLLHTIDISGCIQCSSAAIEAISSRGSALSVIRMNGLSRVSSHSLISLWTSAATSMTIFQMCCDLRSVTTHRKSMMPHFSDDVLLKSRYGDCLTEVELAGACLITDKGVCGLIRTARPLRILNVSYCNALTDRILVEISNCSRFIESLNCSGCIKVTSAGLIALGGGVCTELRKLDFNGCSFITDDGVRALAGLHKLEHLNIYGADFVAGPGLLALAKGCPRLEYIDLTRLDLIEIPTIKSIVRWCPNLSTLNCEGCAFTASEFASAIDGKLPFAKAASLRCKLEAYAPAVINYNKYVQDLRLKTKSIRILQKFCKLFITLKWKLVAARAAKKRLRDMKTVFDSMRLAIKKESKEKRKVS
jgi:F-box/leucine-rich repeat protein 2/20